MNIKIFLCKLFHEFNILCVLFSLSFFLIFFSISSHSSSSNLLCTKKNINFCDIRTIHDIIYIRQLFTIKISSKWKNTRNEVEVKCKIHSFTWCLNCLRYKCYPYLLPFVYILDRDRMFFLYFVQRFACQMRMDLSKHQDFVAIASGVFHE